MTNFDPNNDGKVHGASKISEVPAKRSGLAWLPWLIGALVLLALLLLILRGCAHRTVASVAHQAPAAVAGIPPIGVETVTLPGGKTVDLEPKTLNYELQRYLGSTEAAPRRFTFDRLNFATDSAVLPTDAKSTVSALAQILAAYPAARVALQGYADSSGSNPHNIALGAARAKAVADALVSQGVAESRIKTLTGGSTDPIAANATAEGRAENRRTELVVTAK